MSAFKITLERKFGSVDDTPIEYFVASVDAEAYGKGKGKTPGEALRHLADEFDVEFGAMPRGNWDEIDAEVNLYG